MKKDGVLRGFDIDLLDMYARTEGAKLVVEEASFPAIWESLASGKADIAAGALYLTTERAELFRHTKGYFQTGLVIVSNASAPINDEDGLWAKRVGVKKNATGQKFLEKKAGKLPGAIPVVFENTEESYEALSTGKVDALLDDYVSATSRIRKSYAGEMVVSSGLVGVHFVEENPLVFYLGNGSAVDLERFDRFIGSLEDAGGIRLLENKWAVESNLGSRRPLKLLVVLFVVLFSAFAVLVLVQRRLLRTKALSISEKKYKELFYEAPLAVMLHREGSLIFANREVYRMFGLEEGTLPPGFEALRLFAEGERQMLESLIEARKSGGDAPASYETYGLRSDGTAFPVEIDVASVELSNGRGTLLFIKDVSEKKRMYEELRRSEEKYRAIFEGINEGVYFSTVEGKPVISNPYLIKMLGYDSLEEILNRDIEKEGYQDVSERRRFQEIMAREGRVENFETVWIRKDGVPLNVLESARSVRDEKGRIVGYEGTVRDITEKKRNENLLRQSETYYRSLFENAHDAIMVFDPESEEVLDANEQCLRLYGLGREELIGTSLERVSQNVSKGKERIEEVLRRGKLNNFETVHYHRDGAEMTLEINASVITFRGKPAILSIARDVTDKKKAEKAIMERNRQLLALLESAQAMGSFTELRSSAHSFCRTAVESFNLKLAWIGLVVPESTELTVIASAGEDRGYTENVKVRWDESVRAKGPTGRAIVTRAPVMMKVSDPNYEPWRKAAEERGFKVSCAVPLIHGDAVRGALNLYSADENAFTSSVMEILEIFARHATMAIVTASLYEEANETISELLKMSGERESLYRELEERSKAIQKSEERFRSIVEKARGILLTFDTSGKVTYFNEYAQDFFGFKEGEIIGKSLFDTIVPPTESTGRDLVGLLGAIMEDANKFASNINENVTKEGRRVWIAWTNRPVLDENGSLKEVLSVGTDITQLKAFEFHLNKWEELLREFFSNGSGIVFRRAPEGILTDTTFNEEWPDRMKEKWRKVLERSEREPGLSEYLRQVVASPVPFVRKIELDFGDGEKWTVAEATECVKGMDYKTQFLRGFWIRIA